MILNLDRYRQPTIAAGTWIATNAVIVGAVTIAEDSGIWYNSVIRGDDATITIGRRTNIQDGCVVHADPGSPTHIGNGVSVGHNATLHGCTIGDNTLIGMAATIMNGAHIGTECLIAAGALVPESMVVPDRSLVVGAPAKVKRQLREDEIAHIAANADHYVDARNDHIKAQPSTANRTHAPAATSV